MYVCMYVRSYLLTSVGSRDMFTANNTDVNINSLIATVMLHNIILRVDSNYYLLYIFYAAVLINFTYYA